MYATHKMLLLTLVLLAVLSGACSHCCDKVTVASAPAFIRQNTQCPDCYRCISQTSGQENLERACLRNELSEMLRCASQVKYLFELPALRDTFPLPLCPRLCTACLDDLERHGFDIKRPRTLAWNELYPGSFVQSAELPFEQTVHNTSAVSPCKYGWPFVGDDGVAVECWRGEGCPAGYYCVTTASEQRLVCCPLPPQQQQRGSPTFRALDGDSCCETERTELAYTAGQLIGGVTWHPVYFYDPWSDTYSYQIRDVITCQDSQVGCNPSLQCVQHAGERSYLMTTIAPLEEGDTPHGWLGHLFLILTHPNPYVQFKYVTMPAYCKCVHFT